MHRSTLFKIGGVLLSIALTAASLVFGSENYANLWWVLLCATGIPGLIVLGWAVVLWLKGDPLPPLAPAPDLDLHEFVNLWLGYDRTKVSRTATSKDWARADNTINETHKALTELVEAGRLSQIIVWGRKNCIVMGSVPRGPIPAEDWDRLSIDLLELLDGRETAEVRAKSNQVRDSTFYSDIHLNRAQVDKRWPKMVRKPV